MPLGSIISAASSLFGGRKASKDARKAREREYQIQKEFAQSGIQWKVADARKAGVHPLYALGASTVQYSPQQVGGSDFGIAAAGQDLGRAVNAGLGLGQRNSAFRKATQSLSLQRMELENQLLQSKIATINQQNQPPAPMGENFLIDGQAGAGLIEALPMRKEKGLPGKEYQEPAPITDYGYTKTPTGYAIVQSHDAKDRLEEDLMGSVAWNWRNRLKPMLGKLQPPFKAPPMHRWVFDPLSMEYRLQKPKFRRMRPTRRQTKWSY